MGIRLAGAPVALLPALAPVPAAQTRASITITDEPGVGGPAGSWRLEVEVRGSPRGGVAVTFGGADWGWPSGWTYLEVLASEPEVARVEVGGRRDVLEPSRRSARRARIEYRAHLSERGSERHRSTGLIPTRGGGWALGYVHNVLLLPHEPGGRPRGRDRGRRRGPRDARHRLGRPRTREAARGARPPARQRPDRLRRARVRGGVAVECYQCTGPDHAPFVADLVALLAPAMARHTGWPARSPNRVFLSDAMGGGMGSDFGLHVNLER